MSDSSKRGADLEREVAAILRKKLGARVERDKRSGAGIMKQDIRDYYGDLPFSIECKDQETIKIKDWFRQTVDAASFSQVPTLVMRIDEDIVAAVRFSDLVDLAVEIADLRREVDDLRQPQVVVHGKMPAPVLRDVVKAVKKKANKVTTIIDPAGHVADEFGYCNQKGCKYSRGYRPPKAKK